MPSQGIITTNRARCRDCYRCVRVCPAKAIAQRREDFNLPACYDKLQEFTHVPFVGQHICGVCLKACNGVVLQRRRTRAKGR